MKSFGPPVPFRPVFQQPASVSIHDALTFRARLALRRELDSLATSLMSVTTPFLRGAHLR